jgi:hypothetical protein
MSKFGGKGNGISLNLHWNLELGAVCPARAFLTMSKSGIGQLNLQVRSSKCLNVPSPEKTSESLCRRRASRGEAQVDPEGPAWPCWRVAHGSDGISRRRPEPRHLTETSSR